MLSSKHWIKSDGVNIYINNKVAKITEFDGTTGKYQSEFDPYLYATYGVCTPEWKDCPNNRLNVHKDDVYKLDDSEYFIVYMGSNAVIHAPFKGTKEENAVQVREAVVTSNDTKVVKVESVVKDFNDTLVGLRYGLIEDTVFDDAVEITGNGEIITVRDDSISVGSILAVGKGSKECTQQADIGGVTVMKYETANYEFYQYGDNIIKVKKGINVEDYVKLLPLEEM